MLRAFGHYVVATREVRLERAPDGAQVLTAAQRNLILVTHDRDDFTLLHDAWYRWAAAWGVSEHHAGILVVSQDPVASVEQIATAVHEIVGSGISLAGELLLWNPASGSVATNGITVAEQIGAQIFIDGWAMVAPGQPRLAARLAEQAGKVSHDGEAVHAAMLIAAMEAEAFVSNDMDHILDTGLAAIPEDCLIARLVADIRGWHAAHPDWRDTRQRIEDRYGYDKYPGNCHVVPNHALVIMALLYAPNDFHLAQTILRN